MPEDDPVKCSIGVLIIGSLYWDERRATWRDSRLNMAETYDVRVPIRYGRLSTRRDNTYTMVFSPRAGEGQAKVVRCSHDVSTEADLGREVEELWAAEKNTKPDGSIASNWGCVALLCNPASRIPTEITTGWARRVSSIRGYGKIPHPAGEEDVVSNDGRLQLAWPVIRGKNRPVRLDLLIATANHPTLSGYPKSYPTAELIAAAWRSPQAVENNRAEYFHMNINCGIRTFEDELIAEFLRR